MKTLRQAFTEKYPNRIVLLEVFELTTGVDCTWENITKANLYSFVNGMKEQVSQNSAKTYTAMFKSVLNLYSDQVDLPKGWDDVLSVRKDESEHVYLTMDEIKSFAGYSAKDKTELLVKNAFLISCLTGARHSDAVNFTLQNVRGGFITYVSKKTHIKASIPVSGMLLSILQENEREDIVGLKVSDVTFNNIVRKICTLCHINSPVSLYTGGKHTSGRKYEFVASHTARRSFATNLYMYKVNGKYPFDIVRISKLMGHSSIDMTLGYIMDERAFSDEENSFFERI